MTSHITPGRDRDGNSTFGVAQETPADRLRAAAGRVREGHTRGMLCDEQGNRCAIGALLTDPPVNTLGSAFDLVVASGALPAAIALHDYLTRHPDELAAGLNEESQSVLAFGRLNSPDKVKRVMADVTWWNDAIVPSGDVVAEVMERAADWWEKDNA